MVRLNLSRNHSAGREALIMLARLVMASASEVFQDGFVESALSGARFPHSSNDIGDVVICDSDRRRIVGSI